VDTLNHLPSLPLFIDYQGTSATISRQDVLAIPHALRLTDRVRRVDLHLPPLILHNILLHVGEPFSVLVHLSLSSASSTGDPSLVLPKTCLAPNLRHLTLVGIDLPKRLRLLSSTASLVTLVLTNIRASGYFRPRLLVARLESLPQLEELSVGFSIPIPRPSAEKELLGKWGTRVMLPNLKRFRFQGVSAYLERFVAQIRAPLLELDITLFNQLAFALPHLLQFTNRTEGFKFPIVEVKFAHDKVSVIMGHHDARQHDGRFALHVICRPFDWQIDCAAQICGALMPALFGVEKLILDFYAQMMPTEWQNGEIDGITWHELLRPFTEVNELHACAALLEELSRALQVNDVGSDPGLLPGLQEIVCEYERSHANELFNSFIHARRIAGRPVSIMKPITMMESPRATDEPTLDDTDESTLDDTDEPTLDDTDERTLDNIIRKVERSVARPEYESCLLTKLFRFRILVVGRVSLFLSSPHFASANLFIFSLALASHP
jgi:hypothetical protein